MTSAALILRRNAASCLGFGVLLLSTPRGVSFALGSAPPAVLVGLGVVLLINGAHLLLASMRARPIAAEILWFSMGDMAWWLATLSLIVAGVWITTPTGIALALLVALCVAGLGLAQLFQLGSSRSGLAPREHWRRIGHSWMSLPMWVKIWLSALNATFLLSPVFLPWEAASVVLTAYAASGPLLGAFATLEGGLTRAMGLAHLVPWVPMLGWLTIWMIGSEASGLALSYAAFLAMATVICLSFDTYDLWRWIYGERAIIYKQLRLSPGEVDAETVSPTLAGSMGAR